MITEVITAFSFLEINDTVNEPAEQEGPPHGALP